MKRKRITEQNQLRHSWIMSLCNTLVYRDLMLRSEALRKAFAAWDILDGLGKGTVEFMFRKENGEVRFAKGTLCRGIDRGFDSYQGGRKDTARRDNSNTDGIYTFWDLEKHGFRTFKARNLLVNENYDNYKVKDYEQLSTGGCQ